MDNTEEPVDWRFAPLPVDSVRDRLYHQDMPEKMEMIEGKLFWSDSERYHVLGVLIECLGTEAVERFISEHRKPG